MDDKDIKDMAEKHLEVPEVPRDRMWERIDAARRDRRGVARPDFTPRRPVWRVARWAAGLAAVLLVGVMIGRTLKEPGTLPAPVVVTGDTEVQGPGLHDPVQVQREVYGLAAADRTLTGSDRIHLTCDGAAALAEAATTMLRRYA